MAARSRRPRAASPPSPGSSARPASGPAPQQSESRGPAIVAVLLTPPLPVQAAWLAEPRTRDAALAVAAPDEPIRAICPRAAAAGVAVGQSAAQGRLRCPDLRLVLPPRELMAVLWETMLTALSGLSPRVEATDAARGLAYLDARGRERLCGPPTDVARAALRALRARGLAARAGAGPTRAVALALARRMGADGPRLVEVAQMPAFLRALPLADPAWGLPPAAVAALDEVGVRTLGALIDLPAVGLGLRFGPAVVGARERALRPDDLPLRPWAPPERLEVDQRIEGGLADGVMLERLLAHLAARLAGALERRAQGLTTLTLVLDGEDGAARAPRLPEQWPPLHSRDALAQAARALLARDPPAGPVERVRLIAAGLAPVQVEQHGLWATSTAQGRGERLGATLRAYTRRHGSAGLRRLRRDALAPDGWAWDEADPAP